MPQQNPVVILSWGNSQCIAGHIYYHLMACFLSGWFPSPWIPFNGQRIYPLKSIHNPIKNIYPCSIQFYNQINKIPYTSSNTINAHLTLHLSRLLSPFHSPSSLYFACTSPLIMVATTKRNRRSQNLRRYFHIIIDVGNAPIYRHLQS